MLHWLIERDRAIEMRAAFREVARVQQGHTHYTMPNHKRAWCLLLLRDVQELGRKLAHHITIERHNVSDPEAV